MRVHGVRVTWRMVPGIAWRVMWWPVLLAATLLLCAVACVGYGPDAARSVWQHMR